MKHLVAMAALCLIGASSPALAEDMKMDMTNGGMDMTKGEPKVKADAEFSKAMNGSMMKMMSNMDVKSTGKPDNDFVLMMMPHHQGAIDMAKAELQYGKDPILRKMAQDIVAAQEKEIGEMKDWLAKNGQ